MSPSLQPQSAPAIDPETAYAREVSEGRLQNDEGQHAIIGHLQRVYDALEKAPAPSPGGLLAKLLPSHAPKSASVRSLYIWGPVGRGKSLLMDMFYAGLVHDGKYRTHFHAFMQEVHTMIHAWRQEIESKRLRKDLLASVALDIANEHSVICLDELQVTDVADAMILSKLFTALLEQGVTFVITSNRPPEELYKGGLQRDQYMEFVKLVHEHMDVVQLASPHDYRMQQIHALQTVYMTPLTEKNQAALEYAFGELTHRAKLERAVLEVNGRHLIVEKSYGALAWFSFFELCEKPLGAADYLAIARRFHTVFIRFIPKMGPEKRNESRRFITLIDTLYDHKVKLICTADAPPESLYPKGDGAFEFARTTSRLAEMQSQQYLDQPHIP